MLAVVGTEDAEATATERRLYGASLQRNALCSSVGEAHALWCTGALAVWPNANCAGEGAQARRLNTHGALLTTVRIENKCVGVLLAWVVRKGV